MAFMMPVVKNDWDIYNSNSGRSRRASESADKVVGRSRKVSESRSEGATYGAYSRATLSPHRSAPAMRSLSYCRAPPSRACIRAADSPKASGSKEADKFHTRACAAPARRARCAGCLPYL